MSSIIPIIVAHDAACEKGGEWMFHGMASSKEDPTPEDELEEAKMGCVAVCIMLLAGLGFGIYKLIMFLCN